MTSARTPLPASVPHGRTARRLEWVHLPPAVRAGVEARLGSAVVGSESRTSGFTPGVASVLTCADGSRHFVKAASARAQRAAASSYQVEARKLRALPPEAPAPRLVWADDADGWVVLCLEYAEGRPPGRPWVTEELVAASEMLVEAARVLTPAPADGFEPAAAVFAAWSACWDRLRETRPALPYLDEAATLAGRYATVTAGETLVHSDVRDDNLLLRPDGSVVMCDWGWSLVGAAWLDSLLLLIGPRGDGLDVEGHLRRHPLLGDVPSDDVDSVLALVTGYFLVSADQPRVSHSPYLREAQAWQRDVVWEWLAARRGWDLGR